MWPLAGERVRGTSERMKLNWKPARMPERRVLEGQSARLEPLDPARHAADLFVAAQGPGADPHLWDYLSVGPFADRTGFDQYLHAAAKTDDPLVFAIIADGKPRGVAGYMRITPAHGVIEIGGIWFGVGLQRSPAATEAIFLMARHAFDDLGYRRLEWKCNAENARSRRAAERFGFSFEGIFRQHMVVKDRNRDSAWYAMLDGEWPSRRAAFARWLDAANFDARGAQRESLTDIHRKIR